jgi:hypothetical protein
MAQKGIIILRRVYMKKMIFLVLLAVMLSGYAVADEAMDQALSGNTYTAAMKDPIQAQTDKIIAGLSMWGLIWGLLFNAVGVFAFLYGKNRANVPFIVLGVLLVGYPYVVQDATMVFIIGAALSAALYFFRRSV